MRSIEIPYGRGRQIFHIEDHRLTGVLMPETMPKAGEETEIVRRAISAPIDSARLSTLSQTAERILLITSDHTRPVPSRITLPLLLEEIREGNSAPKPFELILKITKALRFFEKSQGFFAGAATELISEPENPSLSLFFRSSNVIVSVSSRKL